MSFDNHRIESLIIATDEAMMKAGEDVLVDPEIPEHLKKMVRDRMKNHQLCMEIIGLKCSRVNSINV